MQHMFGLSKVCHSVEELDEEGLSRASPRAEAAHVGGQRPPAPLDNSGWQTTSVLYTVRGILLHEAGKVGPGLWEVFDFSRQSGSHKIGFWKAPFERFF